MVIRLTCFVKVPRSNPDRNYLSYNRITEEFYIYILGYFMQISQECLKRFIAASILYRIPFDAALSTQLIQRCY